MHDPIAYGNVRSRPTAISRPTNTYLQISDRDHTSAFSSISLAQAPTRITCPHCKIVHFVDDISSNSHFRCFACKQSTPFADLVAHPGNVDEK
jgi:hypothetical protein